MRPIPGLLSSCQDRLAGERSRSELRCSLILKEGNRWEREGLHIETSHIYQQMKKEENRWKREN